MVAILAVVRTRQVGLGGNLEYSRPNMPETPPYGVLPGSLKPVQIGNLRVPPVH